MSAEGKLILKVRFSSIPRTVWWCRPTPQPIVGGFALTRVTQPSAMKFGLPSTSVPSRVTGIGYMKTFLPAEIFPIDPSPVLLLEGDHKKVFVAGYCLRVFVEVQGGRVHAVAFAGGRRTVIKDMAEVSPASGAE